MKVLLIGGTGTVSTSVVKECVARGYEVYTLNRGNHKVDLPPETNFLIADVTDAESVKRAIGDLTFDVIADFIVFKEEHAQRDYTLFKDICKQFVLISTCAVYSKTTNRLPVTEDTLAANLKWDYPRGKIEAERFFIDRYGYDNFPITIVRISQIYDDTFVPFPVTADNGYGFYPVIDRIKKGKKVIVHGDGTALWNLTCSSDFANGFVSLFGNKHAIGEIFQITSDELLDWNQIVNYAAEAFGYKANIAYIPSNIISKEDPLAGPRLMNDHYHNNMYDNSKIKKICPDYHSRTLFYDCMCRVAKYLGAHSEKCIVNDAFDQWCDMMIEKYCSF